MPAGPIVKWVGGKTRLLPKLLERAPKTYKRYFEPFLGGGAMFFALAPEVAVLGDRNAALIGAYRSLVTNVEDVITRLEKHRANNVNGYYYEVRDWWNKRGADVTDVGDHIDDAAAFIFLNKTCYNGLWRVNQSGGFNVPQGDYENPSIFDADELRAASAALSKATLRVHDFDVTTADAEAGDFVYFDPPYVPLSKTSNFTSYTKGVFGEKQQQDLANHARDLVNKGVHVMLSNNDVPLVYELYEGFTIDVVQRNGTVSSKGSKRGKVNEVIITHGAV